MKEFEPFRPEPNRMHNEPRPNGDAPFVREEKNGMALLGVIVAAALLVGAGLYFWNIVTNQMVSNTTIPGTTTGIAPKSPSNPPTAPGPQGQGESNSTR